MENIRITEIPDRAFIDVVRVREIVKARVLGRKEVSDPNMSIEITSMLGEKDLISRDTVIDSFTYLSGKSVQMRGLRQGKSYLLIRDDNTPMKMMGIPVNCVIALGAKNNISGKSGVYLLYGADQDGSVDKSQVYITSSELFKKQFKVLPNEAIDNAIGKGHKQFTLPQHKAAQSRAKATTKTSSSSGSSGSSGLDTHGIGSMLSGAISSLMGAQSKFGTQVARPAPVHVEEHTEPRMTAPVVEKYTVVATVNSEGTRVGFYVALHGTEKIVSTAELVGMCTQGIVSNVTLVTKDGSRYLRGIGFQLASLPCRDEI